LDEHFFGRPILVVMVALVTGGFGSSSGECLGVMEVLVRYCFFTSECFRLLVVVLERYGLRV